MTDIAEHSTIWYPGIYAGRGGAYAQYVDDVAHSDLIKLVQDRAKVDGEFAINNGLVGEDNAHEEKMRRMMEFVSSEKNIKQCLGHIYAEEGEKKMTVDWVCRDLANASKVLIR